MTQTAYAVRRQAGGEWWSRRYRRPARVEFGGFDTARLFQTGAKALASYRLAGGTEPVEVVEIQAMHRNVYDRWPKKIKQP